MNLLAANNINLEGALNGSSFASVGGMTVSSLVLAGINLLLISAAVGSFLYLLWGAFDWVTSGSEKEGLEKARKKITAAVVGLILAFSVYAIQTIIGIVFLGDQEGIFNFKIPTIDSIPVSGSIPSTTSSDSSSETCPGAGGVTAGTYKRVSAGGVHFDSKINCYKCMAANTPCGGNTNGYPYAYWCPVELLDGTDHCL